MEIPEKILRAILAANTPRYIIREFESLKELPELYKEVKLIDASATENALTSLAIEYLRIIGSYFYDREVFDALSKNWSDNRHYLSKVVSTLNNLVRPNEMQISINATQAESNITVGQASNNITVTSP
ncbi:MAG: hypothetical protein LDLANPLL_01815 [Turneriella sp.]|nr:hypothetical protein [Turneriella sp.]